MINYLKYDLVFNYKNKFSNSICFEKVINSTGSIMF